MKAEGLLLARDMAGDWTVLESGFPTVIRQKFKALVVAGAEGYSEIRYTSPRGDLLRKVYRKRMAEAEAQDEYEEVDTEEYTGDEPQPAKKRKQRGK